MNWPDGRLSLGFGAITVAALAVVPRLMPGSAPLSLIGPAAGALLFLPALLWLLTVIAGDLVPPRVGWCLRLVARASGWLVLAAILVDPAPNLPDMVSEVVGSGLGGMAAGVRAAIAGSVGVLFLVGLVWLFLGSGTPTTPTAEERKLVRTGSSIHPVVAILGRLVLRLASWSIASVLDLLLLSLAWTADGIDGILAIRGRTDSPSRATDVLVRLHASVAMVGGWTRGTLDEVSADWGRRSSHGVWLSPASVSRDAEGERIVREWRTDAQMSEEDTELRELSMGLIEAIDVAIMTDAPKPGADGRPQAARATPPPKVHPYEIRIARAWSRPGYHAIVVQGSPPAAAAAMARVGSDVLIPTLDVATGWTFEQLRGMRLSDRRVAADELRERETGLCVAFERTSATVEPADAITTDPGRSAIDRALRELVGPVAGRYRWSSTEDAFDSVTVTYVADAIRSVDDWDLLERTWRGLGKGVTLYAANAGATLDSAIGPPRFVATLPKPSPEFPAGAATDWATVVAAHPASRRHPLRVIVGLDHEGAPVHLELGDRSPHLLIAGATGSGKSILFLGLLAQLLVANPPDRLRIHILDSVKRETVRRFGQASHVERAVVAEDGADVVAMLDGFVAIMDDRYRELGGRPIGDAAAVHLLVIEEWADLRDLLDRAQLEAVERCINRVGQLGRAAGMRLILVTQKASSAVISTRMKLAFTARVSGYMPNVSDYGVLFDRYERLLPNTTGRMAVSDGSSLRICQGLNITDAQIARVVGTPSTAAIHLPALAAAPEADDPLPRTPTAHEIDALSAVTAARCLYRWQAGMAEPIVVSVRGLMGYVRSAGWVPGRTELYTSALGRLEDLGILEPMGQFATAPRRLVVPDWTIARAMIEAGVGKSHPDATSGRSDELGDIRSAFGRGLRSGELISAEAQERLRLIEQEAVELPPPVKGL